MTDPISPRCDHYGSLRDSASIGAAGTVEVDVIVVLMGWTLGAIKSCEDHDGSGVPGSQILI